MLRAASRAKFWQPASCFALRKLGLKVSGKRAELLERVKKAGQTVAQLRPCLPSLHRQTPSEALRSGRAVVKGTAQAITANSVWP